MMTLMIQTIVRTRDPNAIDPRWYLIKLYILFLIGLSTFLLLTPSPSVKYQNPTDEATMKNPMAMMNSTFQMRANMLYTNWYLTFSFHLMDANGVLPFYLAIPWVWT